MAREGGGAELVQIDRRRVVCVNWHFKPRGQLIKNLESQKCKKLKLEAKWLILVYSIEN